MKKKNYILLGCLAVFCSFVLYLMKDLAGGKASAGYGPKFYPTILICVLFLLMVILLIQTLTNKGDVAEEEKEMQDNGNAQEDKSQKRYEWKMAVIFFLMALAYAFLIKPVGFIITSFAMLFASMLLLGGEWKKSILISAIVVAALYLIFKTGFQVQLPSGILGGII